MTPAAPALISALVLTAVFTVLWRNHRERWIGLWAIAAALWALRYILAVVEGEYRLMPGAHFLPLVALARGFFLLWGAYVLAERRFPRYWMAVFGADVGILVVESLIGDLPIAGANSVTHYALFGGATLWSAVLVWRARAKLGNEVILVSVGLIGIGLANLAFPWLSQYPDPSTALFIVVHAAQLLIGFGALMVFYHRSIDERDAARAMLEAALAKALSGYLPICAHCKSIQNDGGAWVSVEKYFTLQHDAAFSHGICPDCAQKHYGELIGER